jgi:peptidoglycan hydrolase-like protein with peptidoglycan-binding domain
MASRSAKPRSRRPIDDFEEEAGVSAFLMRHRMAVGGLTAFAVAFAYVAANAIWYQPHAHGSAFFATRPLPAGTSGVAPNQPPETIIRLERQTQVAQQAVVPAPAPAPRSQDVAALPTPPTPQTIQEALVRSGDPVVEEVQRILSGLSLYSGPVDGLTGPQTRQSIENYRRIVGLGGGAEIDDKLLSQLGAAPRSTMNVAALPAGSPGTDLIETSSATPRNDTMVMRIQAGLKAFGNDGIEVDGVVGSRTKAAILEFQSLFGLPETGQPDEALYAKMRDIGLTD